MRVSRIVAISVAWALRCFGWRSSSSRLGQRMKGRTNPSGSASPRPPPASARLRRDPRGGPERSRRAAAPRRVPSARPVRALRRRSRARAPRPPVPGSPPEREGGERDPHPGAVALRRLQVGKRAPRGLGVPHPHPYLNRAASHVDREEVLACEHPFEASRACELREGFVEAALAEAEHAARVGKHASVPGSAPPRSESSARSRCRSASAKRPSLTSAIPAIANAPESSTRWSSRAPRRSRLRARSARAQRAAALLSAELRWPGSRDTRSR